jgi:glycosyltransferase involved in cell wall biosynthesis
VKLSVIIPIYNELSTIKELLDRVQATDLGVDGVCVEKELVLVEDCSADGTRELLADVAPAGAKVVYHARNQGKGAAIRTGLAHATGEYVIIQDADLEYDPNEIRRLLEPVLAGRATTVYGSRFLGKIRKMTLSQWLGNKLLTVLTNLLYGVSLTDMETCYKLIPGPIARSLRLRAQRFDFEPEVTAKLIKQGQRILEVPITYSARESSEGKKIGWKDGFPALWALLKYRFVD